MKQKLALAFLVLVLFCSPRAYAGIGKVDCTCPSEYFNHNMMAFTKIASLSVGLLKGEMTDVMIPNLDGQLNFDSLYGTVSWLKGYFFASFSPKQAVNMGLGLVCLGID